MGRKLWKVFIIFTLVFGMTVSFGTSKAEAEGEPAPTASAETTENPQESAVTTVDPGAVPEPTETADIATETPVATEESTAEPQETSAETEAPVETDVPVMMAKSFVTNTVSEPTETPAEDNTPKTYDLSGDQKKWIDWNNTSLKVEDRNGNLVNVSDGLQIPEYSSFNMRVQFKVPSKDSGFAGVNDADTVRFKVPDWVRGLKENSGTVPNGSWKVDGGYIVMQFDPAFLAKNHYDFSAQLTLEGTMNNSSSDGTTGTSVLNFLGKAYSNVSTVKRTVGVANIDLKKTAGDKSYVNNNPLGAVTSAHYQVQVKAGKFSDPETHNNEDLQNIVVNDAFKTYEKYAFDVTDYKEDDYFEKYISYQNINVKITGPEGEFTVCQNGNPVQSADGRSVSVENDAGNSAHKSFKLNGVLRPDEVMVIDYDAAIDEEMYEDRPLGVFVSGDNDKDKTRSGSAEINAIDNVGGERSWIARRAGNTATVTSNTNGVEANASDTVEKQKQSDADWYLTFDKTWLYKGGDNTPTGGPQKGHISNWQISVNEGNRMPIDGYVLEDDFENHYDKGVKKSSTLISGITVTDEDQNAKIVDSITLDQLQAEGGVTSGNWAGSSVKKLVYTFPAGSFHHYRFHFTTKGDEETTGDIEAFNTATLKEPQTNFRYGKYDDYGVARHWTTPGATVTKKVVDKDVDHGLIHWQTTIDNGITVKNGSEYRDYVYWDRVDRSYNKQSDSKDKGFTTTSYQSKGTDANSKKFHQLKADTLNLKVTAGEGNHVRTLENGTDYTFKVLSDDEVNNRLTDGHNYAGRFGDGLTSGFEILFKHDITDGPVLITYDSEAGFRYVNNTAEFKNIMSYRPDPGKDQAFVDSASTDYTADGALDKSVTANGNNLIWTLRVNDKAYSTQAGYVVKDTIPAGLDFDLRNLKSTELTYYPYTNQSKNISDFNTNLNDCDIADDGTVQSYSGNYFNATYDRSSRELVITIQPSAANHALTVFEYATSINAEGLKNTSSDHRKEFINTARLYSDGEGQPEITESSAWAWIDTQVLSKTYQYDSETAPYVHYEVKVNQNDAELAPKTHVVYVQDSGMQEPLIFQRGSLKVKDQNNAEYTEGTKADAEKHTYQFENTENGGFRITIPDKTALTISYKAYAPGVAGDTIDTSNSVDLFADKKSFASFHAGKSEAWVQPKLEVNGTDRVAVKKTDADDPAEVLKGARFAIYEATGTDYSQAGNEVGEITTGSDGIARSYDPDQNVNLHLETKKVYLIKEIAAPDKTSGNRNPYYLVNHDYVRKFYITSKDAKSTDADIVDLRTNHADVVLINHGYFNYMDECLDPAIKTTSVKAAKVWKDNNNQDGKRQDVTFHLNAKVNGNDVSYFIDAAALKDQTIAKDAENQTVEWKNLPVTDSEGNKIDYSVSEDPMDGYTSDVTGNQNEGFTVTNTHTPETVQVSGAKTWNDAEYLNQNGYERPASIEVSVNGTIDGRTVETEKKTVTADDNWTYTFDNLPKYYNGKEITYVVSETKVGEKTPSEAGYESEVSANGRDIVNTPKKAEEDDLTSVKLTVIKRDRKSAKHALLKDTTFRIKKDDSDLTVSGTTDENGQVTLNIPEEGVYTLTETKAPEGYTISDEMKKGLKVAVTKSDTDHVKLTIENNENVFQKATHLILGEKDHFTCGFDERTNSGVVEVSNDPVTKDIYTDKVVNDTPEKETPSSDKADKVLRLNKTVDGRTETVETKTVKATDQNVVWKDQPLYEDGHKVTYTVTEESVPAEHSETPDTADHTNMPFDIGMFGGSMAIVLAALLLRRRYN